MVCLLFCRGSSPRQALFNFQSTTIRQVNLDYTYYIPDTSNLQAFFSKVGEKFCKRTRQPACAFSFYYIYTFSDFCPFLFHWCILKLSENSKNSPWASKGTLVDTYALCVYTHYTFTKNKRIFVNTVKMWIVKKNAQKMPFMPPYS